MIQRIGHVLFALLVSIDQLALVIVTSPLYLVGITNEPPCPDETLSSRVGRYSIDGHAWAKVAEAAINLLFWWQTDDQGRRNHCARSIEYRSRK